LSVQALSSADRGAVPKRPQNFHKAFARLPPLPGAQARPAGELRAGRRVPAGYRRSRAPVTVDHSSFIDAVNSGRGRSGATPE